MKKHFKKILIPLILLFIIFSFDVKTTYSQGFSTPPGISNGMKQQDVIKYEGSGSGVLSKAWKSWSDMVTKWDDPISQIARAAGTMAGLGETIPVAITKAIIGALAKGVSIVAKFMMEIVFIPMANLLVSLAGKLLNYSIQYTIYEGIGSPGTNPISTFDSSVKEIWIMIRDLFNLSFIFILLYIAIKKILGQAGGKVQGLLLSVIISAIFINFSFFCTRIVIDTGNKIATTIYTQVETGFTEEVSKAVANNSVMKPILGEESTVKLSEMMRHYLGLKTIFDGDQKISQYNQETLGPTLFRFIIYVITAFVFFSMTFLLIGRYIMLIFLTAASPIGFIFGSIPGIAGYTKRWWDELIKQVAIAPVFMFFMLMIVKVSQTDSLKKIRTGSTDNDVGAYFNYIIIIALMIASLKITKGLSGKIGGFADKAGAFVAGAALAVTTGGAALAGRQIIGRTAAAVASSRVGRVLEERGSKGGILGGLSNMTLKGIKGTSNASFDLRSSKLAQNGMGQIKNISGGAIDIQASLDSVKSLGKASGEYGKGKTGFAGWQDKQKENVLKIAQGYDKSTKDYEAELAINAQNKNGVKGKKEAEDEAKKKLDKAENNLAAASATDRTAKEAERNAAKADYESKKKIRVEAEKNTAAEFDNRAEANFEAIAAGDPKKKAYEEAKARAETIKKQRQSNKDVIDAKIERIKSEQKVNKDALDSGALSQDKYNKAESELQKELRNTQDGYDREESKIQKELSEAVTEMEEAKTKGIKDQMEVVKNEILNSKKKEDSGLITILKRRDMRKNYSNQLQNKLSGLSKTIMSNKGLSPEKTEMEKTLAELLKGIDEVKNKK